jgi:hypothetical protein
MARRVSTEEVAWHRHEGDVWVVVDGDVYDVTSFVSGATPLTSPRAPFYRVSFGGSINASKAMGKNCLHVLAEVPITLSRLPARRRLAGVSLVKGPTGLD